MHQISNRIRNVINYFLFSLSMCIFRQFLSFSFNFIQLKSFCLRTSLKIENDYGRTSSFY